MQVVQLGANTYVWTGMSNGESPAQVFLCEQFSIFNFLNTIGQVFMGLPEKSSPVF